MIPQRLISQIKSMFGSSSDSVFIKDTGHAYFYTNQSLLNALKLSDEEVRLKLDSDLHVAKYANHSRKISKNICETTRYH